MEALKLKLQNLEWELNNLDTENRKLRSDNPNLGERIDLERELKQEVAIVTEQLDFFQQQLAEKETGWLKQ